MLLLRATQCFLCLIAVWASIQDPVEIVPLEDRIGTLIVTEKPVAFTSMTWRLIFEWNIDPLADTLNTFQNLLKNVSKFKLHDIEKQQLVHVDEALDSAKSDYEAFTTMIQGNVSNIDINPRQKRQIDTPDEIIRKAVSGSTGSLASSLLGLASSEQMDNVHQLLDTLFRRETKLVTVQQLHITTVKHIQSQLDEQKLQMDRFVNMTTALYKAQMAKMKNQTGWTTGNLLLHNDFLSAIGLFKTALVSHRQILTSLDRGYIDVDIIPTKSLQDALLQIRDQIPRGFRLVFDPKRTSLRPYYTTKLASRIPGSRHIRGLLQVPLTGLTDDFILYKSLPFPSPYGSQGGRRFILKDNERYLALSTDRRRFMDLGTIFNQASCLDGEILVCPATTTIITEPVANCLFHLISGTKKTGSSKTPCKLTEVLTEEVYVQAIDDEEWAISTPKPVMLQPSCIDLNVTHMPMISFNGRTISGNIIATIPRHCTATIDHHVVPMRLLLTSDLGRLPSRLPLPPLHNHVLLDLHGTQLMEEKIDLEMSAMFQDILEDYHNTTISSNTSSREVRKLMKQMWKESQEITKIQPSFHQSSWFGWFTTAFWILAVIGFITLVVWVRRRFSMRDHQRNRTNPRVATSSV
jgi:hypothetical protein